MNKNITYLYYIINLCIIFKEKNHYMLKTAAINYEYAVFKIKILQYYRI